MTRKPQMTKRAPRHHVRGCVSACPSESRRALACCLLLRGCTARVVLVVVELRGYRGICRRGAWSDAPLLVPRALSERVRAVARATPRNPELLCPLLPSSHVVYTKCTLITPGHRGATANAGPDMATGAATITGWSRVNGADAACWSRGGAVRGRVGRSGRGTNSSSATTSTTFVLPPLI